MKMLIIVIAMITLPALAIIVFFFGRTAMIPALASFLINSLPFVVGYYLLRKRAGQGDFDHH